MCVFLCEITNLVYNKNIVKTKVGWWYKMNNKLNMNAVNQLNKGDSIYFEHDSVYSIALVIKGRVAIQNKGINLIVGSGSFIGINDLYAGRYQSNYTAQDELLIYVFSVDKEEDLDNVLTINNDYHGLMVMTLNRMIYDLNQSYDIMLKYHKKLSRFITDSYEDYVSTANRLGYEAKKEDKYYNIQEFESELEHLTDKINYYIECRNLPIDVVKAYFSYGNDITLYQVQDQIDIINQQINGLKVVSDEMIFFLNCLFDDSETSLFRLIAALLFEMNKGNNKSSHSMDVLDNIIDQMNQVEKLLSRITGRDLKINRTWMEEIYHILLVGNKGIEDTESALKYASEDAQKALTELDQSFQTILTYGEIEQDQRVEWTQYIQDYIHLKDKTSGEDFARKIRKKVTESFYKLYVKVFMKAHGQGVVPRIIEMFLTYGYADERLFTKEQLITLYTLKDVKTDSRINVFNIYQWLTMIYEGKREPSKNEFDLDYSEMLAEMKKQGRLKEQDLKQWLVNPVKRLEFEVDNMFRYNNRITSGTMASFVPILHNDIMPIDIEKTYVSVQKIVDTMDKLMEVDYSIFDRELLYVNKEEKIEKEYIIRRIYPDIILMPTMGNNGSMWQEIAGKRRDTSGRFLLPIFTDVELRSIFIRLFGRFRWEICRTIEGSAWNDIKLKSLTSEYSDYIQFYKKNRDLSEEKKEKIKTQIQKARNNMREIFTNDYIQWMDFEAKGAIKLNKIVREFMATYCPFAKPIRDQLMLQPLFEEAMVRYNKNKMKKIREIEARYRLLQKDNIELTEELVYTLDYYKEQ